MNAIFSINNEQFYLHGIDITDQNYLEQERRILIGTFIEADRNTSKNSINNYCLLSLKNVMKTYGIFKLNSSVLCLFSLSITLIF